MEIDDALLVDVDPKWIWVSASLVFYSAVEDAILAKHSALQLFRTGGRPKLNLDVKMPTFITFTRCSDTRHFKLMTRASENSEYLNCLSGARRSYHAINWLAME